MHCSCPGDPRVLQSSKGTHLACVSQTSPVLAYMRERKRPNWSCSWSRLRVATLLGRPDRRQPLVALLLAAAVAVAGAAATRRRAARRVGPGWCGRRGTGAVPMLDSWRRRRLLDAELGHRGGALFASHRGRPGAQAAWRAVLPRGRPCGAAQVPGGRVLDGQLFVAHGICQRSNGGAAPSRSGAVGDKGLAPLRAQRQALGRLGGRRVAGRALRRIDGGAVMRALQESPPWPGFQLRSARLGRSGTEGRAAAAAAGAHLFEVHWLAPGSAARGGFGMW